VAIKFSIKFLQFFRNFSKRELFDLVDVLHLILYGKELASSKLKHNLKDFKSNGLYHFPVFLLTLMGKRIGQCTSTIICTPNPLLLSVCSQHSEQAANSNFNMLFYTRSSLLFGNMRWPLVPLTKFNNVLHNIVMCWIWHMP